MEYVLVHTMHTSTYSYSYIFVKKNYFFYIIIILFQYFYYYIERYNEENMMNMTKQNIVLKIGGNRMSEEKLPIDWLIADVLSMKVEAWNIQNGKLFNYCSYLEKRLLQVKRGEVELDLEDVLKHGDQIR